MTPDVQADDTDIRASSQNAIQPASLLKIYEKVELFEKRKFKDGKGQSHMEMKYFGRLTAHELLADRSQPLRSIAHPSALFELFLVEKPRHSLLDFLVNLRSLMTSSRKKQVYIIRSVGIFDFY